MKLYFAPGACSLGPHIVCEELGSPYETIQVDLRTHKLKASGEDFFQINPKGYVPFIELDDGSKLSEAAVILQYLASTKPEARLIPNNGIDQWRARECMNYIATELHKGFANIFHAKQLVTNEECQTQLKASAEKKLTERFALCGEQLKGKQFLFGDNFSVADAYLFTIMRWAAGTQIKFDPNLTGFKDRVMGRPAVQKVLKAEGLH